MSYLSQKVQNLCLSSLKVILLISCLKKFELPVTVYPRFINFVSSD